MHVYAITITSKTNTIGTWTLTAYHEYLNVRITGNNFPHISDSGIPLHQKNHRLTLGPEEVCCKRARRWNNLHRSHLSPVSFLFLVLVNLTSHPSFARFRFTSKLRNLKTPPPTYRRYAAIISKTISPCRRWTDALGIAPRLASCAPSGNL